jgi:signal transduction histidine kinase
MGKQRVVFGLVDLNDLVEQIVTAHQPRAESANVELTFVPQPGLPPVRGEVNQLAQVVTNLISNALNYTPSGYVRVSTCWINGEAGVKVEDTGLGIDPDDLPYT